MVMYFEWTLIDYGKFGALTAISYRWYWFSISGTKSTRKNCCINTLKWEMLSEIATDRARWRKVVKTDGVCKALNQWYIAENTKSNKRQI